MRIDRRLSAGKRFGAAFGALIALGALAIGHPARAEVRELRISRQLGLGYLQLYVTEDQKLIEKHAKEAGLGDVKVTYLPLGSPATGR